MEKCHLYDDATTDRILSQLWVCGYEIRKTLWIVAVHERGMIRFDAGACIGKKKIAQSVKRMVSVSKNAGFFWRDSEGMSAFSVKGKYGKWGGWCIEEANQVLRMHADTIDGPVYDSPFGRACTYTAREGFEHECVGPLRIENPLHIQVKMCLHDFVGLSANDDRNLCYICNLECMNNRGQKGPGQRQAAKCFIMAHASAGTCGADDGTIRHEAIGIKRR